MGKRNNNRAGKGNGQGQNNQQGGFRKNNQSNHNNRNNWNNNSNNNNNRNNPPNGPKGRNNRNGKNRNNRNRDNDNESFSNSGLPKNEGINLTRTVKDFWKEGKDADSIVEEIEFNDYLCPWSLKRVPDKTKRLANAVTVILKKEKLITYKGNAFPAQWPEGLQSQIAGLALSDDEPSPEAIREQIRFSDDYRAIFDHTWDWGNVACAIGHFIGVHYDQLEAIAAGTTFITGSEESYAGTSFETPDGWTNEDTRDLIERVSSEAWAAKLLESAHKQNYDPNYVNTAWAFTQDAPKFGEPSRFVIRQADPHDPGAPDPLPDPVRPVANASFHSRRCQGTHGCSRHCSWNRDFHRADGWSQHNYNNRHGISMYMQEEHDEVLFEDADGDVIMANNFPPWMTEDRDAEWIGQRVNWSRCLASDNNAPLSWTGT